jgi:adenylate kinase family enzyme
MSRVVILGIAGVGKSTLARRISAALGLPLHQMDRIGWRPGWRLAGNDHVDRGHERIMASDRWVIDGYGSRASMERRCDRADTLVLIDQPAWRHYWWAYKRNVKLLFRHNPDLPAGCSKWPLWTMTFKVVRTTRRTELPRLRKLLADRPHIPQFVLRSPREIEAFCQDHLAVAAGDFT